MTNFNAWLPRAQAMKAAGVAQRKIAAAVHAGHESVKLWLEKYPPGTTPPDRAEVQHPVKRDEKRTISLVGPDWLPEAKQMRLDGKTYKQIAAILGKSDNVVSKTFRRYRINIEVKRGADTPPPSWVDRAKTLQRTGHSWKSIAAELQVGVHLVRKEIEPGYAEYRAKQNRDYMDRNGWSMRKEREQKAKELAEKQAAERPSASAGMLAAGRFVKPEQRWYGR